MEEPDPTAAPTALPFPAPTPKPTRKKQGDGGGRDDTRAPTAQPTEVQTVIEIESDIVLDGVSAAAINDDEDMQLAIGNTILATVPEFSRVHSIVAEDARRRRLQTGAFSVCDLPDARRASRDELPSTLSPRRASRDELSPSTRVEEASIFSRASSL